ncbi:hypothetical protein [Pontibacter amylolyticus]|uniref:SMODS-associated and fused to various effectors domain-containing protein n=1 Tax=Pontibacter amylolyticus TaxID=1424080 RepID=A0ABQ1VY89_9BACT|nr:hypothetical protein [Pontibacter amylolyticus]GGG03406.1 hypothetical protein GCM10011323_05280 [Pontibacter amylolyticus]
MNNYDSLVTVLGWEDRSSEGILNDLRNNRILRIYALDFEKNQDTPPFKSGEIDEYCLTHHIEFNKIKIDYETPLKSWKGIEGFVQGQSDIGTKVLLNITTMPRETIWSLLFFLRQSKAAQIDYVYYKPQKYSNKWLSKEPCKPRLLFKHSGITELGKPTALIILTGFDADRTRQLINFYEPSLTVLGIQIGDQFDNLNRNDKKMHIEKCMGVTSFSEFNIDAYSEDHGLEVLRKEVKKLKKFNIIISSLGPKLSAIAIYKLFLEFPQIAISYVSSKHYNSDYSEGTGEPIKGSFIENN